MNRRAFALLLVLAGAVGGWIVSLRPATPTIEQTSAACRDPANGQATPATGLPDWSSRADGFIAHGGGIDGKTYTNSLEALAGSISRGYRIIELDLQVTTDGAIVAAHDWRTYRQRTGHAPESITDQPMSLAEFKSNRIDGRYTPLDEDAIRRIFLKHLDLTLVTDKIRDFPRVASAFPFQERLVVEVFSMQEFARAKAAGIANPMLSISSLEKSLEQILDQPVRHVALSVDELVRCPGAARKIIGSGRRIFAFTSDDAILMSRYIGSHVSAFYSDHWHVTRGRCEGTACPGKPATPVDGR